MQMEYTSADTYSGLNLSWKKCRWYYNRNRKYTIWIQWIVYFVNCLLMLLLFPYHPYNQLRYTPDLSPIPGYTLQTKATLTEFVSTWPLEKCYQPGFSDNLTSSDPNCPIQEVKHDHFWDGKPFRDSFRYHIEPKCEDYDFKHLVVYVYSRMYSFKERREMRLRLMEYMGNVISDKVKVIFVVGVPDEIGSIQEGEKYLSQEAEIYKDILRPDITESYHTLAFKGFAVLQWLGRCSKHTPFFFKMDDDFMLNMTAIYDLMPNVPCQYSHSLMCYEPIPKNHVFRRPTKLVVLKADYMPLYYPLACVGHGYMMTRQVAARFNDVGKELGKVPTVDDMYFSGVLRRKACVSVSEIDLTRSIVHKIRFSD